MKKEMKFKIPVSGSLGLLALGHRGVIEWRKVRDAAQQKEESPATGRSEE